MKGIGVLVGDKVVHTDEVFVVISCDCRVTGNTEELDGFGWWCFCPCWLSRSAVVYAAGKFIPEKDLYKLINSTDRDPVYNINYDDY